MFGIGFTELLLIAVVAILFLGPDKLPSALVEMAKFIKGVKKTIGDAKDSLEEEMKIADLKEEALNYKKQLNDATEELRGFKNLSLDDLDDVTYDEAPSAEFPLSQKAKDPYAKAPTEHTEVNQEEIVATQIEAKNETVTLKKKKKIKSDKKKSDTKKKVAKKDDNSNTKGDA
jgi:sec-independent protein translocase protein TatB